MKVFSSVVIVALIFGVANCNSINHQDVQLKGMMDNIVNSTINKIIQKLPEVMTVKNINLAFPETGMIVGSTNISSLNIIGLKQLVASYIKVNAFKLHVDMTIDLPMINVNTIYGADVTLADLLPLYGNGKMNVNLEGTQLKIAGGINMKGGISFKGITVTLAIGSATFDLHGLINNEDFSNVISGMLNDNVALFINEHQELISGIISPIIETALNSILKKNNAAFMEVSDVYKQM